MILCPWEELKNAVDPVVFGVIEGFMTGCDVATIPTGRQDLEHGCYVNVDSYETRENHIYEAHKKFVDVQLMVDGDEDIFCAPLRHGTVVTPYNEEKDCWFFDCDKGPFCTAHLTAGMAALLLPWDLHAPCNRQEKRQNRKLVFKIPVELVKIKKTVACCGDSITFGLLATSAQKSYPAVLQGLLGDEVRVGNYGRNGATVIADYPLLPNRYAPYLLSPEYAEAMISHPQIVILKLGMNDGNPTHHFNSENGGPMSAYYEKLYEDTLVTLVENFRNLPTKPQVYLAQTTAMRRVVGPVFSEAYIRDFTENTRKIREIQLSVSKRLGVPFIDTVTEMEDPGYYRDGCHLTDAGYDCLARIMYDALTNWEEEK